VRRIIEQGGKISAIATGCDTSGRIAQGFSKKAAVLTGSVLVDA